MTSLLDDDQKPWGTSDTPLHCPDVAIIFEGGGMRNAYTAAAVQALVDNKVIPGWVGGVSAGSTHAANLLVGDSERAKQCFVDFVEDPRFSGWNHFARGRGYFNSQFIYEQSVMPGEIAELDFTKFAQSAPEIGIGALEAESGETVYWSKSDMPDLEALMARVRASSTIPLFMPVAYVEGKPYFDGAMGKTGGIAYDAAIDAGFSKFLFILTRPRNFFRTPMARPTIIRNYFRKYPAVAEAVIHRADHYNNSKNKIIRWEEEGKAIAFYPETMPITNKERNITKLQSAYELGRDQVAREWPQWKEFLQG